MKIIMIIFLLLIALLCIYKLKFIGFDKKSVNVYDGIYTDYMSLDKTTSIKGIFILIVFLNHSVSYLTLSGSVLDKSYNYIVANLIGQSMVSLFMLYSGYGVMLSIDKKGRDYIKSIPSKRFLKVLFHFDIAVLIFFIVGKMLGNEIGFFKLLLSFSGWDSVGNSNWYIFDILVLYLLTYVSFIFTKDNNYIGLVINIILCCVFVIVLRQFKDVWWYDTIMCYPVGMLYCVFKSRIDKFVRKNAIIYYILLIASLGITAVCFKLGFVFVLIKHIFFALSVVLITMKFSINNKLLNFFGKHLFSIYILQRIPMNILSHFGVDNKYIFVVLSFIITIVLAVIFDFSIGKLDAFIFKNKKLEK